MKKILSLVLAMLLVFAVLTVPASAASYPIVMLSPNIVFSPIYIGDNVPLLFDYNPAYNNEQININIYDPDGTLCANSSFDINNKYSNYRFLTLSWDTADYEPGTYTIEVEKNFYTYYNWHTAPSNSTYKVTLVKPTGKMSLKNPFSSSKTHFQVKQKTKINAPKSGIANAVSAWKLLNISNVKNPYTIQLTEMYTGSEAEKIVVEQNPFNYNDHKGCNWTLCKFEITNTGKSTLAAGDLMDWIYSYLPSGHKGTLLSTPTFNDMPNNNTKIEAGKTAEVWFGFYNLASQGLPFLRLKNNVFLCIHPNCASAHQFKTTTQKATLSKDGTVSKQCKNCRWNGENTVIKYPKTIKLSATSYTYDGKAKKPTVTVKDSKGKKIAASNYTVTYSSGCKKVGKYSAKITFKGNYKGSKTLNFTIKPKSTSIKKVTSPATKQIKVTLKKYTTQTTGYQIQYSTNKNFKKNNKTATIKSNKTTTQTITGLKAKTTYYVRIRTFKTVGKTKYYSDWSKAKTIKTK